MLDIVATSEVRGMQHRCRMLRRGLLETYQRRDLNDKSDVTASDDVVDA